MEVRHVELDNARMMFPRDEAKGKKKVRYVYLTDAALAIVRRRTGRRKKGHVFLNTDGLPWTPYSVGCRFGRLKEKLGVRYCLYHFRHTWQTRLLKKGVDPITCATLAGHVDTSMLAKTYAHLSQDPAYLHAALRRASGALGGQVVADARRV
jgi:integrase